MTLKQFNALPEQQLTAELTRCCGSSRWVAAMISHRPFAHLKELYQTAADVWWKLAPEDWQGAFRHHPQIGDVETLRKKFASTRDWSEGEQAGVQGVSDDVLLSLAEANKEYLERFGYIFIVSASGKTAQEMLNILRTRMNNDPAKEITIAAREQESITRIRLGKLVTED